MKGPHTAEDLAFLREKGFVETADEIERLQEAIPVWMTARGYATGHGDTIEDMLSELETQAMRRTSDQKLRVALEQCEEYFDNRADVKDGDYGAPEPNTEMRLLAEVREALGIR